MANVYDQETEGSQKQKGSSLNNNGTGGTRASFGSGSSAGGGWAKGFGSDSTSSTSSQLKQAESGSASSTNPNRDSAGSSEGGASDNTGGGRYSNNKLKAKEESPNDSNDDDTDNDDGLWKQGDDASSTGRKKARFGLTRRRVAIGGLLATMTVTGTAGWLSIVQGPGQLVQLSEILKKPLSGQNDDSSYSMGRLLRWARTGNYGETRVGAIGGKIARNALDRLEASGITLNRGSIDQIRSGKIDTGKLQEKLPELKDMSGPERQAYLEKKLGIPEGDLRLINGSRVGSEVYYFNAKEYGSKTLRGIVDASLQSLDDGKVITGVRARVIKGYTGLPSVLSPIHRKVQEKVNQTASKLDMRKLEKDRQKKLQPKESSKFQAARDKIKSAFDGKTQFLSRALLFTGGMCIIRDIAEDVPAYNRGVVVMPSVAKTASNIAAGGGVMSNQANMQDVRQIVSGFTDDKGKTIWSSKPLDAMSRPTTAQGEDIPSEFKQAYSIDTTAASIENTAGGGGFGAAACSPGGIILQIAGSALLFVAGPESGGATWGTIALKFGASAAATGGAIAFLQHLAENKLETNAVVPDILSGPLGGSLMAYSSREFEGIVGRSSGGVALSPQDEALITQKQQIASAEEFHRKSLFEQVFDRNDYRSVSSQVAMSVNPSITSNISSVASSLFNLGGVLSHFSSLLTPRTSAADAPYDWGFPLYGLPQKIKDDSRFDDPYDNADKVASLLDGDEDDTYKDRASKCFGVNVSKGSDDLWQVIPSEDVNPNDTDYINAHCSDLSDTNWERLMLFVLDSRTADAWDCYSGGYDTSDQSCKNVGMTESVASSTDTPTTATTTGSLSQGSSEELAQQLLPYIAKGKVTCNNGQADGPREHTGGRAADFNYIDGVFMGPNDAPWDSKKINAAKKLDQDAASFMPKSTEFGQVGAGKGHPQCHPGFDFLSGFKTYPDGCHHQHIAVEIP
jgi:hypothetical protein